MAPVAKQQTDLPMGFLDRACDLAGELLQAAHQVRTAEEVAEARKIGHLLADDKGRELTFELADQVFRPPGASRQAAVYRRLLAKHGAPRYLKPFQRVLMHLGSWASRFFPGLVMPAIMAQIRKDSRRVILPREDQALVPYLQTRSRVNLNLLGEAVLGEQEAQKRLDENLKLLAREDCDYLSVKISSIFSQINLLDEEGTLKAIKERLRLLYRTGKFINLDMEEYRDLQLTYRAFRETLSEPEFSQLTAGIVLQAYLPDSYHVLQELTEWAKKREAPIKVRIVKGANLAMEAVEASIHGWVQAPYDSKYDVDANFKRMLIYACERDNTNAVRVGVASHNLFDIAFALLLREYRGVEEYVELEMLEGMANDQSRVLEGRDTPVLFYAPIVSRGDFPAAIAYLVRRLDENTSDENFLSHVFSMVPGDAAWSEQERRFRESFARLSTVSAEPRRCQDRSKELIKEQTHFENVTDTDWTLTANQQWLKRQFEEELTPPTLPLADEAGVQEALKQAAGSGWPSVPREKRARLLRAAAVKLAEARGRLIAVMRIDASKRAYEADIEVSEAIDFANYYAEKILDEDFHDGTWAEALGPVVVTPPWNFPCAIPCGGVLAALAAGNPVILKPAPETIWTAWEMIQCLWQAGISEEALQFLPCPDNEVGQSLITAPEVASVILTGGSETADLFLSWRPDLRLYAETSGKNALIITASADPDLAVKDLVHSAFGHAGQKCSAASLALVEAELYDSPRFLAQLHDAASSLHVGPATDPAAIVTPLIRNPQPALLRGLTELDDGESWLLKPQELGPQLWSPGIRLGVKPGSWIHRTELFGPVLAVIRVDNLEEALAIQNGSDFGLTGGIHSLDPGEIKRWREAVEVGNAYINRPITGAIVQRQPFGGWKRSAVGEGAKAGGPNYVTQFSEWTEESLPVTVGPIAPEVTELLAQLANEFPVSAERLTAAAGSYAYWWKHEFSKEHDPSDLHGESNHFRYRPAPEVVVSASIIGEDRALAQLAAMTVGTRLVSKASHPLAKTLMRSPLANGRLELLQYLHEQSVTETTHRYGRVAP